MSEVPTKPWYESKTIWASVASIIAVVAGSKGVPVDPEMIAAILFNVVAVVGRVTANRKIERQGG